MSKELCIETWLSWHHSHYPPLCQYSFHCYYITKLEAPMEQNPLSYLCLTMFMKLSAHKYIIWYQENKYSTV